MLSFRSAIAYLVAAAFLLAAMLGGLIWMVHLVPEQGAFLAAFAMLGVMVGSAVTLAVLSMYLPPAIIWVRGLWKKMDDPVCVGNWKLALSSRQDIRRVEAYNLLREAFPRPSLELYEWFGDDAPKVFRAIGQVPDFLGKKYRITPWLQSIRDADIRDFDLLIGYIEVAGVEAAVFAIAEDVPIEYAKAVFVVA